VRHQKDVRSAVPSKKSSGKLSNRDYFTNLFFKGIWGVILPAPGVPASLYPGTSEMQGINAAGNHIFHKKLPLLQDGKGVSRET
jgi:hypothetical protein